MSILSIAIITRPVGIGVFGEMPSGSTEHSSGLNLKFKRQNSGVTQKSILRKRGACGPEDKRGSLA